MYSTSLALDFPYFPIFQFLGNVLFLVANLQRFLLIGDLIWFHLSNCFSYVICIVLKHLSDFVSIFRGSQEEQVRPPQDVITQSWYPPSVSSSRPGTPGSTSSRPQSPSHVSPAEAAGIISALKDKRYSLRSMTTRNNAFLPTLWFPWTFIFESWWFLDYLFQFYWPLFGCLYIEYILVPTFWCVWSLENPSLVWVCMLKKEKTRIKRHWWIKSCSIKGVSNQPGIAKWLYNSPSFDINEKRTVVKKKKVI